MVGSAAKSSQHFYYACQNYSTRGKQICSAKMVNRAKIEKFLVEKIKDNILTEQNLTQLVKLTNAELRKSKRHYDEELKALEHQINK